MTTTLKPALRSFVRQIVLLSLNCQGIQGVSLYNTKNGVHVFYRFGNFKLPPFKERVEMRERLQRAITMIDTALNPLAIQVFSKGSTFSFTALAPNFAVEFT